MGVSESIQVCQPTGSQHVYMSESHNKGSELDPPNHWPHKYGAMFQGTQPRKWLSSPGTILIHPSPYRENSHKLQLLDDVYR